MDRTELITAIQQAGQQESRLSLLFRQQLADKASLHGTDMECMEFILGNKNVTPSQLCKTTGLSSGAMTAVLGRLEKQNLIHRQHAIEDRRKVYVIANMREAKKLFLLYASFVETATALLHTYNKNELQTILKHYNNMSEIYAKELGSDIK